MSLQELTFHQLLYKLNQEEFVNFINVNFSNVSDEIPQFLNFIELLKEVNPNINMSGYELFMDNYDIEIGVASRKCGTNERVAIDFKPWQDILAHTLNIETIKQYPLEEIAFHVLYDMSFDGFQEDERKAKINSFISKIKNIF